MPLMSSLRVAKTCLPEQNGAKRHGEQLVRVRHRLEEAGTLCHTTADLLAESTAIALRSRSLVALRIAPTDKATRTLLVACGAQGQAKPKYWIVTRLVAKNLRLLRNTVAIRG